MIVKDNWNNEEIHMGAERVSNIFRYLYRKYRELMYTSSLGTWLEI